MHYVRQFEHAFSSPSADLLSESVPCNASTHDPNSVMILLLSNLCYFLVKQAKVSWQRWHWLWRTGASPLYTTIKGQVGCTGTRKSKRFREEEEKKVFQNLCGCLVEKTSKALRDKTHCGTSWPILGRGAKAPPNEIRCEFLACHRNTATRSRRFEFLLASSRLNTPLCRMWCPIFPFQKS